MNPDRWEKIQSLFVKALELEPSEGENIYKSRYNVQLKYTTEKIT